MGVKEKIMDITHYYYWIADRTADRIHCFFRLRPDQTQG